MSTLKYDHIEVSRQTLDNTPARVLAFLRAIGTDTSIHAALARVGFQKSDLENGWTLLRAVSTSVAAPSAGIANPVAIAIEKLEVWNGQGFVRARAALRRMHPAQEAFVFAGLEIGRGAEAVLSVATFLDRCDALQNGADRKSTRKADHAALDTLEARGITKAERKELRELVDIVQTLPAPLPDVALPPLSEREKQLVALYAWHQDWSDTARTVIKRRDQLIRLGLGKRRSRKPIVETPDEPPMTEPTPSVPPSGTPDPVIVRVAA